MISQRLIDQIHASSDRLTNDLVEALHADPKCEAYSEISGDRLAELKDDLYKNLGRWLRSHSKSAIEVRYLRLGRERNLEGIPLSQLIYALNLTKSMLLNFIRRCATGVSEDLNLEYELAGSISEFFDQAIYFASIGYEDACKAGLASPLKDTQVQDADPARPKIRPRTPVSTEEEEYDLPISRGGQVGEASG